MKRKGALVDETDLMIMAECSKEKSTLELAERIKMAHKNLLAHLKKLESQGMITRERKGKFVFIKSKGVPYPKAILQSFSTALVPGQKKKHINQILGILNDGKPHSIVELEAKIGINREVIYGIIPGNTDVFLRIKKK
jgi:DNA-binding transcriptional ArsR family regulator